MHGSSTADLKFRCSAPTQCTLATRTLSHTTKQHVTLHTATKSLRVASFQTTAHRRIKEPTLFGVRSHQHTHEVHLPAPALHASTQHRQRICMPRRLNIALRSSARRRAGNPPKKWTHFLCVRCPQEHSRLQTEQERGRMHGPSHAAKSHAPNAGPKLKQGPGVRGLL